MIDMMIGMGFEMSNECVMGIGVRIRLGMMIEIYFDKYVYCQGVIKTLWKVETFLLFELVGLIFLTLDIGVNSVKLDNNLIPSLIEKKVSTVLLNQIN